MSPDQVIHHSRPLPAWAYDFSMVVYASPRELMQYFAHDLSWLEKYSALLKVDSSRLNPHTDMTEVGQWVDFGFKILGIYFPCRMTCLKYQPDQELWWMMSLLSESWISLRFEVQAVPEGSRMNLHVLGQPPQYLEKVVDTRQLLQAVAARADLVLTLIQAEFDAGLDVPEVTGRGLRGDLYQTLLQGDQASLRVNAPPRQVVQWILSDPAHFNLFIPHLQLKGRCAEDPRVFSGPAEELVVCPALYPLGASEIQTLVLSKGGWTDEKQFRNYSHNLWMVALDNLARVQFEVSGQKQGSQVKLVFTSELSETSAPEAIELLLAITAIPRQAEGALLEIKAGVEGGV
ncbi:MAG: hypothetical protein A2V67_15310 [Deltaproteobacteria bacterium RBG_13_61_14]|nr:MAG: hypothetical protein A2V67_15310 [Deltaproteobacteria bacterium RBG_13_61_14]